MPRTKTTLFLLTQAIIWLWFTAVVLGQATPPKPLTGEEFSTLLQSRLKQVDDLHDLSDAEREKVKDLYQQALGEMEAAKRWAAKAAQFEKDAAQAPLELQQTKAALAQPAEAAPVVAGDASLPQIEQAIAKREVQLEQWRTALAAVESELKGRANRRVEIPKQITQAKERLSKINTEFQALTAGGENSPASSARRMVFLAQRRTAEQEILCGERELAVYETLTELLPLRRDLGVRRIALAEQVVKQLQELVNGRRQQEAEQQLRQASREAGQAHPTVLLRLIKGNADLADARKSLAARIVDATAQLEQVSVKLGDVKELFKQVQERVAVAEKTNTTRAIGLFLRKKREELPNLHTYRHDVSVRQQTMGEGELDRLQLVDDRTALANVELQTQAVLQTLNLRPQNSDRAELEKTVREALKTKSEYLDAYIADHDTYFKKLGALTDAEQQLIEAAESCAQYINQRVLWISSAAPLSSADLRSATDASWWLLGPGAWLDISRTLALDAVHNLTRLLLSLLAGVGFLLLIYWRRRFRLRIQQCGEKASRKSCYRFLPTLETALLTGLVAVGWPGLMYYLGWRLTAAADASDLCRAVGEGLIETARVFFALQLLMHGCGRQGLAESHFGWSAPALKLLRQNTRWFSLPALPLMCVAIIMAWQENDQWDTSLGRICFIAALLVFALAVQRILRPASTVCQAMVAARRGGWMDRFRYVWYPLCALTPVALAVLAALGYHYGARQLVVRLLLTAYVLVGGIVCRALLLRWTLVNQRKLAIEQARLRRAAHTEGNGGEEIAAAELLTSAKEERDLATINIQTRRMIEYSLAAACALVMWWAWIDVLPALDNINVKAWDTIRLADLALAALILATTMIAAKNIPGLLEMAVLQHLPFDAGARYAVATVSRYAIFLLGVLLCCNTLGVSWSKVQWLVAAMSLGLGFGLQEIFANFVSGLIILFERPIRVRDVVTIDNVTGVVSRIRMRATTITDPDRKELIIPNKDFITGRVLNWTLTDPVNRVVINVGLAYGCDTHQAVEILLKVAQDHPSVLDDPPPRVTLDSFGDSALNFVLRCFLPNLESRATVIHELNMAIDRALRGAGIEMPFPQQDVHVRSIDMPASMLPPSAVGHNVSWPAAVKLPAAEEAA
jgi:potassium efflux system protein